MIILTIPKGYGFSDIEKRTPVSPETTLFRPGSVSKLFTWTAVMQLVEHVGGIGPIDAGRYGRVVVDDCVQRLVEDQRQLLVVESLAEVAEPRFEIVLGHHPCLP